MIIASILTMTLLTDPKELQCLTDAVFHEARGQSYNSQLLTYRSIINRAKDSRWKVTACGVTKQKYQYSYTLLSDKILRARVRKEQSSYNKIKSRVRSWAYSGRGDIKGYDGINHYLRCDIIHKVTWNFNKLTFLGKVGDHCYYKG